MAYICDHCKEELVQGDCVAVYPDVGIFHNDMFFNISGIFSCEAYARYGGLNGLKGYVSELELLDPGDLGFLDPSNPPDKLPRMPKHGGTVLSEIKNVPMAIAQRLNQVKYLILYNGKFYEPGEILPCEVKSGEPKEFEGKITGTIVTNIDGLAEKLGKEYQVSGQGGEVKVTLVE